MTRHLLVRAAIVLLPLLAAGASAQDWPAYGVDEGGGRFSPLTEITPANVATLQPAWTYHMNPQPGGTRLLPTSTTTPLEIGGTLYLGTPYGRVVALDATTGRERWTYTLPGGDQPAFRGLAYWPGDGAHAPRLIFGTLRGNLIALDAASGHPSAGFGTDGVVATKTPEIMNGLPDALYSYSAPPAIYKDLAIIGSRVQEAPAKGAAGDVRAWNVVTGKLAWTFHSIPRPGERYHDTWEGAGWVQRSGVNVWNMVTVDAARDMAFLSFGAPTNDRYGGDHKGANLYANALVAVRASTGQYLWHFQTVHHDIWDYDLHTAPVLLTVRHGGRTIPAVATMNKTALLFLLDRTTGKPIYPVRETPVPASSAPGEAAAPTQPIPTLPGVVTRMAFDPAELDDTTPAHLAACRKLMADAGMVGSRMFEPIRADHPMVRFPGGSGGPEWGGGAFDPRTGLFVFAANQIGYVEQLKQAADGSWSASSTHFMEPGTTLPCQKTPWGELIAVNVNTGRVAWKSVLGTTDTYPEGRRATGRPSNGGPIVTASGLTFIGGTDDSRFRAFETRTGRELWTVKLDHSAHATPITYRAGDGRQMVAIVATGGSYLRSPSGGDSLVAFALPPSSQGARP